jgi:hypothetical protein
MMFDDSQSRSKSEARSANAGAADALVSRRAVLRTLGLAGVALASGCTPLRIVLHDYPEAFDKDTLLTERILRSFVTAVVPGADPHAPDLVRAFFDPAYPFAPHAPFFAADLCRRSRTNFGRSDFDALDRAQRTHIIVSALNGDGTTRKLYGGAIFLTQVAVYAGIYDDTLGCDLIEFRGSRGLLLLDDQTYPQPERFLSQEITAGGNAA